MVNMNAEAVEFEIERLQKRVVTLSTEVSDLRAVYEAAEGVALNRGAARELSINILIDVLAAVSDKLTENDDG